VVDDVLVWIGHVFGLEGIANFRAWATGFDGGMRPAGADRTITVDGERVRRMQKFSAPEDAAILEIHIRDRAVEKKPGRGRDPVQIRA